jgi:hypothetical protein
MRRLILALALLLAPVLAFAQTQPPRLGRLDCTGPRAKLIEVEVALLENGVRKKWRTLKAADVLAAAPAGDFELRKVETAFTLNGVRLRCVFAPNDGTWKNLRHQLEGDWQNVSAPIAAGTSPKIRVNVHDLGNGWIMVWIGNVPPPPAGASS